MKKCFRRVFTMFFFLVISSFANQLMAGECQDSTYCAPMDIQATVAPGPSILVTWRIYNNYPDKIFVNRSPGGSGFPAERPGTESGLADTTAQKDTLYSYQVCAHYDDEKYCSGIVQQWLPSGNSSGGALPPAPVFYKPEIHQDHIRISWSKSGYSEFNIIPTSQGQRLAQLENESGIYDLYSPISGYTYTFSVQGFSTAQSRWSAWSAPITVRFDVAPKAPGNFYVEGVEPNNHYRLHWDGYRDADMYHIVRGKGSVIERTWNRGVIEPLPQREHAYEFDDTDKLLPMTDYWYELCAVNVTHSVDGFNSTCVRQSIKTFADIAQPPTDVRVAFVPDGAEIKWTANDDTVLWYEVERRDNMEWKVVSNKLERHRDGKQSFLDTNLPPVPVYAHRFAVYRVCAGNVTGRDCSNIAAAESIHDTIKLPIDSVMRILQITPARYAKAFTNSAQIEITLTYSGDDPKSAAYRSDGGQWVTANVPLRISKPGTAIVTILSSVFQNSNRTVDVLLKNEGSEAFGTINVMNVDPAVQIPKGGIKGLERN